MPYNGSGTFTQPYNWTNDAAAGILIRADRMDGQDSGIATGLSTAICKDGQTTITANLPMATFRHTGVGNGVARTDYASLGQIEDGAPFGLGTIAGTGDAITANATPAITAYATNMFFWFKAGATNTTASTINLNGVGNKTIKKNGADTVAGDIISGQLYGIIYDGTNFQLVNSSSPYITFAGASSSGKTYTLPNASTTILTTNAAITVAQGGTGAATLTGVLKGNGTSAFTAATAGSDYVAPGTVTSFTAQQNFTAVAITSTSASIAWNLATAQSAKHTFTENTTLANPTNMVDGATYVLRLIQHASSPKTLAFGNAYRTPGGAGFTVSASNSAVDILTFVSDGTHMDMVGQKAFS